MKDVMKTCFIYLGQTRFMSPKAKFSSPKIGHPVSTIPFSSAENGLRITYVDVF